MSRRPELKEVAILRREAGAIDVIDVSEETWRWARRDCALGPERRRIRKPFAATLEKIPNLFGPVLRLVAAGRAAASRAQSE